MGVGQSTLPLARPFSSCRYIVLGRRYHRPTLALRHLRGGARCAPDEGRAHRSRLVKGRPKVAATPEFPILEPSQCSCRITPPTFRRRVQMSTRWTLPRWRCSTTQAGQRLSMRGEMVVWRRGKSEARCRLALVQMVRKARRRRKAMQRVMRCGTLIARGLPCDGEVLSTIFTR